MKRSRCPFLSQFFCDSILKCRMLVILLFPLVASAQQRLTGTPIGSNDGKWVGLDLSTSHVITSVGICPISGHPIQYGIIEGANNSNFSDALPLYMFLDSLSADQTSYIDIHVSRGFRYVRFLARHGSDSEVARLDFYGIESEGDDSQFYSPTNLPAVSIYVENLQDPVDKINQLSSIISVISADGTKLVQDSGTIRLRGNFSLTLSKKPYQIKFDSKKKLLGSPAKAKKWTLIPSYLDKTLMRNMLSFEISRRIGMSYTPFCVPVNVWVNGDFKGCYELCDKVEIKKGRIDIDEMDSLCVAGDSLTGGYLIEIDEYANEEPVWFNSSHKNPISFKSPDSDEILDVQRTYITNHFNKMENKLYKKDFDEKTGYQQYLDLNSFLKRHLCEEFIGNTDTYYSVFMYKPRGDDKLYACPIWDQDLSFDDDYRTYPINEKTDWLYRSGGSTTGDMKKFVDILLSDSCAEHGLQAEWARLRATLAIDETELLDIVDSYADTLNQSQEINFWRWPIMQRQINPNLPVWGSYAAEVAQVKDYISKRIPWMDKKLSCESSTYNLSISSAGWATLYIPFAAEVPNGLNVYTVTGLDGKEIVKEETFTIEANKPYLVKGTPGLYTISGYKIPVWDARQSGLLTGSNKKLSAPVNSYVLQKQNGIVGFYRVYSGSVPTIMANKAYLTIPSSAVGAPLHFYQVDDTEEMPNGLETIDVDTSDGVSLCVYNLRGELVYEGIPSDPATSDVLNNLPKGIYVIREAGKVSKRIIK